MHRNNRTRTVLTDGHHIPGGENKIAGCTNNFLHQEFIYRKQMSRVNRHKKLASDHSVYTKTVLRGHDVTLDRLLHSYDNQLSNRCSELDHEMYIVETYGEEILPRCQKVHDRCVQNTR